MANVTITQLPAASGLSGTELVPIVQNGQTVQTTVGSIASSPTLTQTFLTVGTQSTLANSRYLAVTTGISLTDGGALGPYTLALTGAASSILTSPTGLQVKTGPNTLTSVTIAVTNGLSISNANGVSGNPTISLSGLMSNLATQSGTGLLAINGTSATQVTITGTSGQISVANGNASGGYPTLSLATTGVSQGTYTAPTVTIDQYGRITSASSNTLNAGTVTSITAGAGLTGGTISTTGTIALAAVGTAGTYGNASTLPVIVTNAYGQITTATNTAIAITANQVTSGTLAIAQGGTNSSATPTAGAVIYGTGTAHGVSSVGSAGQVLTSQGSSPPTWTSVGGTGTVTSVSVVSANGFAGTVANQTTTPAITLTTSITGVLKGNGTAISAATAGTDYLAPPGGTAIQKANSGGALINAVAGTDYAAATSGSAILYGNGAGGFSSVTVGTNLTFIAGTLAAAGSVSSVTGTGTVNGITLTGTVTSSGSLTLGGTLSGVSLTSQVSGTLPVANGGTGAATLTGLAYGNGTSAFTAATAAQVVAVISTTAVTNSTNTTNILGGAAGSVPYNSASGTTTFLSIGTSGYVLTAGASAPQYVAQSTLSVGSATTATTATTATNATNVALSAGSGATNYLHFSSSATGNQPVNTNTSLTYNYTNNAITSGINGGTF